VDANLAVVDDEMALEQCQDWGFFVELVNDLLGVVEEGLDKMQATIAQNDHAQFGKEAHALKGAALNLHLPAMSDVTKKAEIIGKQLALTPDLPDWLAARQVMVEHIKVEYERLKEVLPSYQARADAEGEEGAETGAGGMGAEEDDDDDDGDGPTFH
jgi:HPt (histidine-containing phosphotransfer) domain-containing protein